MKKITKSMVAVGTAAMLAMGICAGMTGCSSSPYSLYSQDTSHVENAGKYIIASEWTDNDSISNLCINWSNGKIIIENTSDEWMSYEVTGDTSSDATCYYINNTSMWIEESDPNGAASTADKTLTLYVPTWDYLEYLEINGENVTVESKSTAVRNIEATIEKGDITAMGSGLMTEYHLITNNGSISLNMPTDYSATITAKSTSGKVTSTFGELNDEGQYVNGEGKYHQELTASGNITITDSTISASDYTWEHWINSERYAENKTS